MEHFAAKAVQQPLKVVIAEEDARLRRIIRLNLERNGFQALEAASLKECQAHLRERLADLAIVSSHLPDFDALQFSQWLRSNFPLAPIPVLILSFEPEDRLLTLPLRVAAFRRKPFDPGELVAQVVRLLRSA